MRFFFNSTEKLIQNELSEVTFERFIHIFPYFGLVFRIEFNFFVRIRKKLQNLIFFNKELQLKFIVKLLNYVNTKNPTKKNKKETYLN